MATMNLSHIIPTVSVPMIPIVFGIGEMIQFEKLNVKFSLTYYNLLKYDSNSHGIAVEKKFMFTEMSRDTISWTQLKKMLVLFIVCQRGFTA